jgi:hypothetical protein
MPDWNSLVEQARQTHERLTRRLEIAIENQNKFPARGRRTTAYFALQGRIERLRQMQASALRRYQRREKAAKLD